MPESSGDISRKKWNEFAEHYGRSFFQTYEWADILERSYDRFEISAKILVSRDSETLIPLMRENGLFQRYYSMPFGTYGGFLPETGMTGQALHALLRDVRSVRTTSVAIFPHPRGHLGTCECMEQTSAYTHILFIEKGFEYLWRNRFKPNHRRGTKRAEESGVYVFKATSLDQVKEYYDMYLASSARWGLKNPHPYELFKNIFTTAGRSNADFWLAGKGDQTIAGILTFKYKDEVMYWSGASFRQYWRYCPNNLLLNEAIKDACAGGFEYFNLGGSGELSGVRAFKESFGAVRIEYPTYRWNPKLLERIRSAKILSAQILWS